MTNIARRLWSKVSARTRERIAAEALEARTQAWVRKHELLAAALEPDDADRSPDLEPGPELDYDLEAARDAYYLQREREADLAIDAAACAAMDANPQEQAVLFEFEGEQLFAIKTGEDEYAIRTEAEYDPAEFGISCQAREAADGPELGLGR
ncbi:hypothetical protein ABT324_30755 [Saccharopolyspora sp. NPDC000359]|uniref:hypothetical protein n=1 Tax=Saccharopolyspora sp. NPDC000359 TaxID=3154251 RepID=UPI00332E883C